MGTFTDAARALGFDLEEAQLAAFAQYRDRVADAAGRFSLTAVRDPEGIERRHFLEALALGRALRAEGVVEEDATVRVLDLGSGAGFPGLALQIAWPFLRMALLEANEKRCAFLRETIAALGLDCAEVLEGRAETLGGQPQHRAAYDIVLARAIAPLRVLLEYAAPFLRTGGWLAAPKGSAAAREVAEAAPALAALGFAPARVLPFAPPFGRPQALVLAHKLGATPARFPRRPGMARKRPL